MELQKARDLIGTDPKGFGRDLSIAYTHIEDGALRIRYVLDMMNPGGNPWD